MNNNIQNKANLISNSATVLYCHDQLKQERTAVFKTGLHKNQQETRASVLDSCAYPIPIQWAQLGIDVRREMKRVTE